MNGTSHRLSGTPRSPLRLDPVRVYQGRLKCSDLDPLAKKGYDPVRDEPRSFRAVAVSKVKFGRPQFYIWAEFE